MSYSFVIGAPEVFVGHQDLHDDDCDCNEARRACMPTFVFSVPGQVRFRRALFHLTDCRRQVCRSLRAQVVAGMQHKLHWLFQETAMLGCVHVQPYLYGSERIVFDRKRFSAAANHLAYCPKESCAQLRRALLLSVRDRVSPNAHERVH